MFGIKPAGRKNIGAGEVLAAIEVALFGDDAAQNGKGSLAERLDSLCAAIRSHRRRHDERRRTLERITGVCRQVSGGDFEARLIHIGSLPPEERAACDAVNDLIDRTDAFMREATASLDAISHCRYDRLMVETGMQGLYREAARKINTATQVVAERVTRFADVIDGFRKEVSSALGAIDAAGTRLEQASSGMTETAAQARSRADNVSDVFTNQVEMVSIVADATQELSSSIAVLGESVQKATGIAGEAVRETAQTEAEISRLSEASETIGDVLELINDIAEQTNLLALNATIEAARAGEAGKGFAVVAQEVKNLAGQTARATEDIARQIDGMRQVTNAVVAAMERIGGSVRNVDEIAMTMAAAVTQQSDATDEIAGSARKALQEIRIVEQDLGTVSSMAGHGAEMAVTVHEAATNVRREAGNIRELISGFLDEAGKVA